MDRYQQLVYEKDFRIAFLETRGDAFQRFFEKLMAKAYPGDFVACRPWGNIGDRKNDGYLASKRILFQVYAPNDLSAAEAITKINEDFEGAKAHWQKYFDEWVFVHNTHDGRLVARRQKHRRKRRLFCPYLHIFLTNVLFLRMRRQGYDSADKAYTAG